MELSRDRLNFREVKVDGIFREEYKMERALQRKDSRNLPRDLLEYIADI